MGYTHYWKIRTAIDDQTWSSICADVELLIAAKPGLVCLELDMIEDGPSIRFNGKGDDGHETFVLKPDASDFCKTARKPYDLMVCAVLAVAKKRAPTCLTVSSDGRGEDGWNDASTFVKAVLGYHIGDVMKDIGGAP